MSVVKDFLKFFDKIKNLASLSVVREIDLKYFLKGNFKDSEYSTILKDNKKFVISAKNVYGRRYIDYILDGNIINLNDIKTENNDVFLEIKQKISELKQKYLEFKNYENFGEDIKPYINNLKQIKFVNDFEETLKKLNIKYDLKEKENFYYIAENNKRMWGESEPTWKSWKEKHYLSQEEINGIEKNKKLGLSYYRDENGEDLVRMNINDIVIKKEITKSFTLIDYGIKISQEDSKTFENYKELNIGNIKLTYGSFNINDEDYKKIEEIKTLLSDLYKNLKQDNSMNCKINQQESQINRHSSSLQNMFE